MAKFFHKMSFWDFLTYVLTPFLVLGEGAIIGLDLHPSLHVVVVVAVIVTGYKKYYIKDENGNGIADSFEKSQESRSKNPRKTSNPQK